jgi:hypothetical protein
VKPVGKSIAINCPSLYPIVFDEIIPSFQVFGNKVSPVRERYSGKIPKVVVQAVVGPFSKGYSYDSTDQVVRRFFLA